MKLLQSLMAALLVAAGLVGNAAETTAAGAGSCDRPATPDATAASIVSVPAYAADASAGDGADEATDPQAEAAARAWTDYQQAVASGLAASPDPRDWALAAVFDRMAIELPASRSNGDGSALLRRALAAAGDDTVVLWVVALGDSANGELRGRALQRLRVREPGNAAVWLADLTDATRRNDNTAVRAALTQIAVSATFASHQSDVLRALIDAYRRFPPPAELLSVDSAHPLSADGFARVSATAISEAIGLPGFQPLVNACRIDTTSGRNVERSADCAAAGRLLATHADTLLATHMGQAVLRAAKTYSDDDVRTARAGDWIYTQFTATLPTEEDATSLARFAAYQDDWIATGNELEAMRRAAQRAGIASQPPDGWVDRMSPLSARRIEQDVARSAISVGN